MNSIVEWVVNDLSVKSTSLFNFYKTKIVCQFEYLFFSAFGSRLLDPWATQILSLQFQE